MRGCGKQGTARKLEQDTGMGSKQGNVTNTRFAKLEQEEQYGMQTGKQACGLFIFIL